jgi:hypothetical protein
MLRKNLCWEKDDFKDYSNDEFLHFYATQKNGMKFSSMLLNVVTTYDVSSNSESKYW